SERPEPTKSNVTTRNVSASRGATSRHMCWSQPKPWASSTTRPAGGPDSSTALSGGRSRSGVRAGHGGQEAHDAAGCSPVRVEVGVVDPDAQTPAPRVAKGQADDGGELGPA